MYQTKAQYDKSNMILTEMLSSPLCRDVLSNDCIKVIENFQCSMIEKEQYLAFYVRKIMSMSFDAMKTSPVESMNNAAAIACILFVIVVVVSIAVAAAAFS